MNRRTLPLADFQIPEISLGCMSLPEKKNEGIKIIQAAISSGINLLDTADLYQRGFNEEMVGEAIQDRRDQVLLASKVGNEWRKDGSGWDWNPKKEYILKAVDASLARLKTDYIDLCQLHGGTIEDPWDETLEAFEILKKEGKIRAFGISSIRLNVIRKVMELNPPASIMMQYSPLDRRPEEVVFPVLEQSEIRVLVRGAFAKGLLIDKESSDFLSYHAEKVKAMKDFLNSFVYSTESLLIRFGLSQKAVASLVIGASSVGQVEKMLRAYEEGMQIEEDFIQAIRRKLPANHYQDHR